MPEVTIKTLQQKVFKVVVEDSDTIATLKQKIEADQGFAVNTQKLIFSGKILADDRTIESLQIKEKDFLVVMVSKPKPQPATPKKDEAKVEQPAQKSEQPEQPQQTQQPASSSTPSQPGNNLAMGSELETAVSNMVEMGFDRAQVMKAMRASFNNPERAVEYLMTGIPQHLQQPEQSEQPQQQSEQQPNQPTGAPLNLFDAARQQSSPAAGQAAPGGDDQQAQLAELVQAAQENPALLQSLIQEIAQSNPTLAQLLAQNPQALLDLLSGEGAEGDFQDEDGPGQVIHLTEEQAEAVARLEALGFSREMSAQALLACEGNEELAANYLFEQQEDL